MEESRKIKVIANPNLREVINTANELQLTKEDIISIIEVNGQFCLIYYK